MHPVLFNVGDTPIHAYGFLIAVALILGWVIGLRLARLDKLPADVLGTGYVISVALGLVAARAMWLFQHPDPQNGLAAMMQLQAGGLAGGGGILAALIVAGLHAQSRKIPPWAWLDCVAPAFLIGVALERIAAYLSGSDFGHFVDPDFVFAVEYPIDSAVYEIQKREWSGLQIPADMSLPVHPSQIYAALAALIGVGLTFWVRKQRRYSGEVALFALAYYGVVRYAIEDPFRYDSTPEIAGPITLGAVAAVVIVTVCAITHFGRIAKLAEDPSAVVQWTGGPWTPGDESSAGKKKSGKKKSSKKASGKPASSKSSEAKPEAETDAES
ncbi:prolipoprotein diacylglyceryl transferase [Nannocystaceae bacterium ST9]